MLAERDFPKRRAETLIEKEMGLRGPFEWQRLHGDGSDRVFYRAAGRRKAVVVIWSPPEKRRFPNENDSYVYMGRHLHGKGIPVPRIFSYSRDEGLVVVEDLGSIHLQEAARAGGPEMERLYWKAAEVLLWMQVQATEDLDTSYCFDTAYYDPEFVLERELAYFHQSFLRDGLGLNIPWEKLEPDFGRLASRAGEIRGGSFFLHRDFQSRNLLVKGNSIYVVDFQGARLGPPQYDLAALVLDAYVEVPPALRARLFSEHAVRLGELAGIPAREFRERYPHVALCRNLQMLAAFSFLARVKGRRHFSACIIPAWQRLCESLAEPACSDYAFLGDMVREQSRESIKDLAARLGGQEAAGS